MIAAISARQNCRPSGVAQCSTSHASAVWRSSASASAVLHGAASTTVCELLHGGLDAADVLEDIAGEPERRIREAQLLSAHLEDALAVVVGGEEREAELLGQGAHPVLRRSDPLAAELHQRAVRERVVEDAPADAIASLEHDDRVARRLEIARGRQAGQAGAHDDDIDRGLAHARMASR